MLDIKKIKLVAIDADDTLFETQPYFDRVEDEYCKLLDSYISYEECAKRLFKRECDNMYLLGYGSKAFIISLIENAIEVSKGRVSNQEILKIIELGKSLFSIPTHPLKGVEETLERLKERWYKLIVFTKGDSKEQEEKLFRSGLLKYFDDYKVYTDKTTKEYIRLLKEYNVSPQNFLMVGNSFKSDIEPVIKLGGYAVHIPFHTPWKYEKTDEYEDVNCIRISTFKELGQILTR